MEETTVEPEKTVSSAGARRLWIAGVLVIMLGSVLPALAGTGVWGSVLVGGFAGHEPQWWPAFDPSAWSLMRMVSLLIVHLSQPLPRMAYALRFGIWIAPGVLAILLLAPFARGSRVGAVIRWGALVVWALWWLTSVAQVGQFGWYWLTGGYHVFALSNDPAFRGATVIDARLEPGYWLAVAGALVGAVGLALLALAIRQGALKVVVASVGRGERARLGGEERIGAWVFTAAPVLWLVAFYTLPWAVSAGCSPLHVALTHYYDGVCASFDASDVLTSPLLYPPQALTILLTGLSIWVAPLALGIGAVVAAWTARRGALGYVWMGLWLTLATGITLLGVRGAGRTIANPVVLGSGMSQTWGYGTGLGVALAALLVAAAGVALLVRGVRRRTESAQVATTVATEA